MMGALGNIEETTVKKKGDFFCWMAKEQRGHQTTLKTCQRILSSAKETLGGC
jgi:hypothetical protein